MNNLNPDNIQDLVVKAFCVEAISDKKGCTTRYVDLDNKPLLDFVIAGINVGKYFRSLASDIQKNTNPLIFKHYLPALNNSNLHKSQKTINFGLLEIMFPVVYARMISNLHSHVMDNIINIMKKENTKDVENLIMARKEAWKTSIDKEKRDFDGSKFNSFKSPYEFYMALMNVYGEDSSNYQWASEYKKGLPILRKFFNNFMLSNKPLLEEIKDSFNQIRDENPSTRLGIIADMCAAAIFLYLSYK